MASQSSTHSVLLSLQWLVNLCWLFLLRCSSPFSYFPVWGCETKNEPFTSVSVTGGDMLTERNEGSHPCQAFWSLSCPTYRCLLKRCFDLTVAYWIMWLWHFNSLLDLFCLCPWGWEGLVFWPLMCLKKSGYLYHCFFALILWLLLWGAFWCAELSFMSLLHGMSLWFIFVLGTNHPSCSLLCTSSWKQVIADQFIWKTCAYWQLYRKCNILMRDILPLLGGMDGIAAIVHFPLRPFHLEKISYHYNSFIKRIFFTFCCLCFLDD